jgi:hypothetical protein
MGRCYQVGQNTVGRPCSKKKNLREDASYPHEQYEGARRKQYCISLAKSPRTPNCAGGRRHHPCRRPKWTYSNFCFSPPRKRPQRQMSISSPSTALEHPDIAGREEIISELDGASFSSSATVVVLLILFTLAQCFGQSMAIRLSPIGIRPLR